MFTHLTKNKYIFYLCFPNKIATEFQTEKILWTGRVKPMRKTSLAGN